MCITRTAHESLGRRWYRQEAKTWLVKCLPKVGKGSEKIGSKALIFLILPHAAPFCVDIFSPEDVEFLSRVTVLLSIHF